MTEENLTKTVNDRTETIMFLLNDIDPPEALTILLNSLAYYAATAQRKPGKGPEHALASLHEQLAKLYRDYIAMVEATK